MFRGLKCILVGMGLLGCVLMGGCSNKSSESTDKGQYIETHQHSVVAGRIRGYEERAIIYYCEGCSEVVDIDVLKVELYQSNYIVDLKCDVMNGVKYYYNNMEVYKA